MFFIIILTTAKASQRGVASLDIELWIREGEPFEDLWLDGGYDGRVHWG